MPGHFLFTVTKISPDGRTSRAFGLNDGGVVVGDVDGDFPWVFSPGGVGRQLQALPTSAGKGVALRVNNAGAIVGQCDAIVFDNAFNPASTTQGTRAVLWANAATAPKDLGTLLPTPPLGFPANTFFGSSRANDINNAGHIVGDSEVAPGLEHPFFLDGTAVGIPLAMRDLDVFVPLNLRPVFLPRPGSASALNDNGDIALDAAIDDATGIVAQAFLLNNILGPAIPFITLLQALPSGLGPTLRHSVTADLNINKDVVGASFDGAHPAVVPPLNPRATFFRIPPPAATVPIPVICRALGINDAGAIVGSIGSPTAIVSTSNERGFLIDPAHGGFHADLSLGTPGFTILRATGINNNGQISAIAFDQNQQIEVGVLLTP